MSKPIYIYLSRKHGSLHEIYHEGKPSGEIVSNIVIKRFLTVEQYAQFLKGEQIFHVSPELYKKRYSKDPAKRLIEKAPNNFKFK
ncbi:MAG: hypothetical protein IMZ64_00505 [Bacteroidetes bacterium]|nr:hypothetical protein [Bacteroidota bacterium]